MPARFASWARRFLLWEDAGSAAYDEGVWTSPAGLKRLKPAQTDWTLYFVDVRQGADLAALDRRLAAAGGKRDGYWPNDPPAGLDNLEPAAACRSCSASCSRCSVPGPSVMGS